MATITPAWNADYTPRNRSMEWFFKLLATDKRRQELSIFKAWLAHRYQKFSTDRLDYSPDKLLCSSFIDPSLILVRPDGTCDFDLFIWAKDFYQKYTISTLRKLMWVFRTITRMVDWHHLQPVFGMSYPTESLGYTHTYTSFLDYDKYQNRINVLDSKRQFPWFAVVRRSVEHCCILINHLKNNKSDSPHLKCQIDYQLIPGTATPKHWTWAYNDVILSPDDNWTEDMLRSKMSISKPEPDIDDSDELDVAEPSTEGHHIDDNALISIVDVWIKDRPQLASKLLMHLAKMV
jgi:hypothetical protein